MLRRTLGTLAAFLGLVGSVSGQPAARLTPPSPPAAQVRWQATAPTQTPAAPALGGGAVSVLPPSTPLAPPKPVAPPTPLPSGPLVSGPPSDGGIWIDPADGGITLEPGFGEGAPTSPSRLWVTSEWLYWVTSGDPLPPLLTTAPAGSAGSIGTPGTAVLFGGSRANNDFRNGLRTTAGYWIGPMLGLEANFFFLGRSQQRFAAGSDGSQVIARPFYDATLGRQNSQLVSFPGVVAGTASGSVNSDFLGGGGNVVWNLAPGDPSRRLELLVGYRYLNLRDDLFLQEQLRALTGAGTRFAVADQFKTVNQFNGPTVGFDWERRWSHWFVGVRSSLAMGVSHQATTIAGSTTVADPAAGTGTFPAGILALPTNSGVVTRNRFAVVPEAGVRLGVQVTERLRVYAGYDILYWSNVARAGDQIDLRLNPTQFAPNPALVGTRVPVFFPRETDFWAQGVSIGLEWRF